MYYRQFGISSVLSGLLMISTGTVPVTAATQVNLSASNCIPRSADHFNHNNANEGFLWVEVDEGAFVNEDDGNDQVLVCAIPYDPLLRTANNTIPTVEVKVDVVDRHDSQGVQAKLFRQDGNVNAVEVDSASTSVSGSNIRRTLILTVNPTALTKYLWILVTVPDQDDGRSGVIGYTVRRP